MKCTEKYAFNLRNTDATNKQVDSNIKLSINALAIFGCNLIWDIINYDGFELIRFNILNNRIIIRKLLTSKYKYEIEIWN